MASVLINSKWRSKHFFTKQSKEAPCISALHLNVAFGDQLKITIDLVKEELDF